MENIKIEKNRRIEEENDSEKVKCEFPEWISILKKEIELLNKNLS